MIDAIYSFYAPVDPVIVQSFILYSAILALKMLAMSALTAGSRLARGVFANIEDAQHANGVVKFDDPVVERIRRAHRNDLENIPVFWILGALYLTTQPYTFVARLLFRAYAIGRLVHTLVYAVWPLPQPARGIAFGVTAMIQLYMAIHVVLHYVMYNVL